jgi:phage shock protein A
MPLRITRKQLRQIILSEARALMERGENPEDFANFHIEGSAEYEGLVDAFRDAMDVTGETFDGLIEKLRADLA